MRIFVQFEEVNKFLTSEVAVGVLISAGRTVGSCPADGLTDDGILENLSAVNLLLDGGTSDETVNYDIGGLADAVDSVDGLSVL